MDAGLERILDDALAAFDEDDFDDSPATGPTEAVQRPQHRDAAGAGTAGEAATGAPESALDLASAAPSGAVHEAGRSGAAGRDEGPSTSEPGPSGGQQQQQQQQQPAPRKAPAFDPLGRSKPKPRAAAPGASGGGGGASGGGGGGARPALRQDAALLEQDLLKLVEEWSTAMHPDADASGAAPGPRASPAAAAPRRPPAGSAVLRALEEQTRRTVAEQGTLGGGGGSSSGDDDDAGGGGGDHVSMIVDVVMQHLLSKDVLYQPMKEIRDQYPPWLKAHRGTVPAEDLARYEAQHAAICRLVEAYEAEPANYGKIMGLLQEMQACGEPPPEIVEDMSSAIGAELPPGLMGGGGGGGGGGGPVGLAGGGLGARGGGGGGAAGGLAGLPDLDLPQELLGALPENLRNCPVQ